MDTVETASLTQSRALPNVAQATTKEKAREVADEFESMFISQMLAPMFASLETDGLTGGGSAERAFRPMLVEEYAKQLATNGGLGLSDQVYSEILKLQGLVDTAPTDNTKK